MNIQEIRKKYPQYDDLSDLELADGFHSKFYADIPKEEFYKTIGIAPKSTWKEDIGAGVTRTLGTLVQGVGLGAEALAGVVDKVAGTNYAEDAIRNTEMMADYWREADPTKGKEQGAGKITSAIASLPAYMSPVGLGTMLAGQTREAATDTIKAGGSTEAGLQSGAATLGTGGVGAAIPIGAGLGRMGAAGLGAGSNVVADMGEREIQNAIRRSEDLEQLPELDKWDLAASAVPGAGIGFMAGRAGRPTKAPTLEERIAAKEAERTSSTEEVAPADAPLPQLENEVPTYKLTEEDVLGRSQEEAPLPTLPWEVEPLAQQYPQGIDIGTIEAGGPAKAETPLPSLENINQAGLLDFADYTPTTVPDTQRLATRHDIPEATIDFPLRQEVLQQPEISNAIDAFRAQAADLEKVANNAINEKVRNKARQDLEALQEEFAAGMRELGIDKPQDAIGLQPLYEGGKGKTKLPIQHGFSKKQRGSVDPSVFVEGFKKVKDIAGRGLKMVAEYSPSKKGLVVKVQDQKGKQVGGAVFSPNKDSVSAKGVMVDPEWQRKGVATEMYNFVSELGNDITPSADQTPAGKAMWDSFQKPGQTRFGKSQRGSVNLFATTKKVPSFENYHKALEEQLGRKVDESIARELYEEDHPSQSMEAKKDKTIKKIPGMKDVTTKYGSGDPDDISGTVQKMVQSSVDLEKPAGAFFRNLTSAGRLQAWMLDNPVVTEGTKFITSVLDKYRIQAANQLSDLNKLTNFFDSGLLGRSWKDAYEVFKLRRENEMNPNFKPEEVLSGKQLEMWQQIDKVMNELHDQVNARRKELNPDAPDLPKLPFYLTSYFRGDWQIPVFSESGKFLFNLREDSKANAENAAKWAADNGFVVKKVQQKKSGKWADRRYHARTDFEEMMDVLANTDPDVQQALTRMIKAADQAAMNTRDMPSRFKNKSGKVGSLGDRPWRTDKENYNDFKKALEMYVAGANEWLANTQISRFTREMNNAEMDTPNAKSFINDYADYVTGNKEVLIKTAESIQHAFVDSLSKVPWAGKRIADSSRIKSAARTYANIQTALFVGYFSSRMFAQNAVQPFTATIPKIVELSTLEGVDGNLPEALSIGILQGLRDFSQLALPQFGESASTKFKKDNLVVNNHIIDNMRMFDNYTLNKVYDTAANLSIRASEQFARSISFSIYQRYFESAGYDSKTAMDMAKNLTHETMGNYENYAKAQVFGRAGTAGELSGRLQTFKVNAATQTMNYLKKAKMDNPASWAPLATNMFMNMVTAGAIGIIGMDVAELLWDAIQKADRTFGEPTEWIQDNSPRKFIYDNAPDWVSMGALSVATGANLSGAFTQQLVGDNPIDSLFPVFSGLGEVAQAPLHLLSDSSIDKARGLQAIAPSTARPIIEREFLTNIDKDGTRRVVSSQSGNPVYKGKGQGYYGGKSVGLDFTTNIQTLERGKQSLSNRFHREYSKDVAGRKKELLDNVNKYAWEIFNKSKSEEEVKQKVGELANKYYAAGGDPQQIVQALSDSLTKLGIGDNIVAELAQQYSLSNRKTYDDALKQFRKR